MLSRPTALEYETCPCHIQQLDHTYIGNPHKHHGMKKTSDWWWKLNSRTPICSLPMYSSPVTFNLNWLAQMVSHCSLLLSTILCTEWGRRIRKAHLSKVMWWVRAVTHFCVAPVNEGTIWRWSLPALALRSLLPSWLRRLIAFGE
jgi:hypothetical protein